MKILKESFLIWFFLIFHILFNIYFIPKAVNTGEIWPAIFLNFALSFLSFPSIYIFFNYLNLSLNKEFIIAYNYIKLIDVKKNKEITIPITDIIRIELHKNKQMSYTPWSEYEYFCFIDKYGNRIVVTSYTMTIVDFWTDSLSAKVDSGKLKIFKHFIPVIRKDKTLS